MNQNDRMAVTPFSRPARWHAVLGLAGWVGMAVATAAHPPVGTLRAWRAGLAEVARTPQWGAIHLALMAGAVALVVGLAHFHGVATAGRRAQATSHLAVAGLWLGLALWLIGFSWELAVIPPLARLVAAGGLTPPGQAAGGLAQWLPAQAGLVPAPPLAGGWPAAVLEALWAFPMLVGYTATALWWASVGLWGATLLRQPPTRSTVPRWLGWWGALSAALGLGGLPMGALAPPRWGVPALALSGAPAAAWLLAGLVLILRHANRENSPPDPRP